MKNTSTATTRSATSGQVRLDQARYWLVPAQLVASPETRLTYRVERFLGEGGFGQVYLAQRLGRSSSVAETVCIKISPRIDGWLREAYFGQLLDGHPRAIRVYDAFPLFRPDGQVLYCLALEYARHGDLRAYLHRAGQGWAEKAARREIAGILEVLGKLHRGQMLHRDLTPLNVFVCEGPCLKLGDFGIVRQQSSRHGITAHTMNTLTAPSEIIAGAVPKWQARDDVYQVGQLLGMLVKGDASARLRTPEVRRLACSALGRPRTTTVVCAEGAPWTTAPALRAACAASLLGLLRMPVNARWTPSSVRNTPTSSAAGGLRSASIISSALS